MNLRVIPTSVHGVLHYLASGINLGDLLREEISDSRLLVLERAAHVPMFDRPGEFNAALLAFFAGEPVGD